MRSMPTLEEFNRRGEGRLPHYLGMVVTEVAQGRMVLQLEIVPHLVAPNGYLHAGTVVALADTSAGYGCMAHLPEGARGFTTIELKSNHMGTAREGTIVSTATPAHLGRTTQVWDAVVTHAETGKTLALFRCTQLILYP